MWWFHGIQLDFDIYIYRYIHTQWWFFENFSWKYGDFMGFALMGIQFCLCVAMVSWGFKPQITAFSWDEMELGMVLWEFKPKFQWFTLWEDVMELNPKYWRFQKKRISTMCFLVWGSKQIGGICLLHLYCFLLVRIYIYIFSFQPLAPEYTYKYMNMPAADPRIYIYISIPQPPTPECIERYKWIYIYIYIHRYSSRRPQVPFKTPRRCAM